MADPPNIAETLTALDAKLDQVLALLQTRTGADRAPTTNDRGRHYPGTGFIDPQPPSADRLAAEAALNATRKDPT